ncbi:MAG: YtxH domain-containing protein, partial [Gemmatimonadales bacterium]
MSDRDAREEREDEGGGGFGGFVLGLALGAVLGFLFAPDEGRVTRKKLSHRLRDLRELADEKAGELRDLVAGSEEGAASPYPTGRSDRQALQEKVREARRRRRARA